MARPTVPPAAANETPGSFEPLLNPHSSELVRQLLISFQMLVEGRVIQVQATTVIVETVIVESTVLVEQKPLTTTQFYSLQTTILVETTVIMEQKP